jgi:hypothetical protein
MEQYNSEKLLKTVTNVLFEYDNQNVLSSLNSNDIRLRTTLSINTENMFSSIDTTIQYKKSFCILQPIRDGKYY